MLRGILAGGLAVALAGCTSGLYGNSEFDQYVQRSDTMTTSAGDGTFVWGSSAILWPQLYSAFLRSRATFFAMVSALSKGFFITPDYQIFGIHTLTKNCLTSTKPLVILPGMADWKSHLDRAVRHFGSQQKLANALGWTQSRVSYLVVTAEKISAEDSLDIHRVCDGVVTASQLRPDLWPTDLHIPPPPSKRERARV